MAKAVYITQDGITDHIGQSQIAPYLIGLAHRGHSIHVVSAEKRGRNDLRARYQQLFNCVGIRWTAVPYANRPPLVGSLWTMLLLWRAAHRVSAAERPDLVHCRSYLPLELGARLKRRFGIKYLADFRDFWADVGLETKPFKWVYRWFLKRESVALGNADHVVTLTFRATDRLIARHPHVVNGSRNRYSVIPCCADFNLFDPAQIEPQTLADRRRELAIPESAIVLLYLGSLGPDYLLGPMMTLFREIRKIRPDAVFVLLVNNGRDVAETAAAAAGVPRETLRFISADRSEIPAYLALASLAPVFIRPTASKAGCCPTKLGELFAMNVPIIANSGYGDIDRIIGAARGSVLVNDFAPETLRGAVETILSRPEPASIRDLSSEFSLEQGVRRYDQIYRTMAGQAARVKGAAQAAC